MGIRIQPIDVVVSAENPFENDLLDRKPSVELLTSIVSGIEGPCVLALDGAWGAGKTTFLKMWQQYLVNKGFPTIAFNAWETDFTSDPFLALITEVSEGLSHFNEPQIGEKLKNLMKKAEGVIRFVVPKAVSLFVPGTEEIIRAAIDAIPTGSQPQKLNEYQEAKQAVREFKEALLELSNQLSESIPNHPLIFRD